METDVKIRCRICNLDVAISDVKKHPKKDQWICITCLKKLEKGLI